MAVLWCGGEDIDFPKNGPVQVYTVAGQFRAGYGRCALGTFTGASNYPQSNPFVGGAVTSAWLTFRILRDQADAVPVSTLLAGLVSSSKVASGLWIGTSAASNTRLALYTFDGTTKTALATESGNSFSVPNVILRIDVQLVSYGASATVTVYADGTQIITFSGDVRVDGLTNVDAVGIFASPLNSTREIPMSEIIVADEDVRAFPGLVTLALTGAGTTDQWTGIFSDVNGTTISDTTPNYTNTTAQDQQYNWTDLPAGAFIIKAVKIAARMTKSSSPAVTQVKLGYNSGGTVAFGTGATKPLTTAYVTYEQLDSTNPVTAVAFVQSEMNALQVDLRSLT